MFGIGIAELLILFIVLLVGAVGLVAVLVIVYFVVRAAARPVPGDKETKSHRES